MRALPLLWKFREKYKHHLVLPGQFHTAMNYLGMITNHNYHGSGYGEIVLEAQLVTSGCLKSVLRGKAYSKALFYLKTVCVALEWLLLVSLRKRVSSSLLRLCSTSSSRVTGRTSTLLFKMTPPSTSSGIIWSIKTRSARVISAKQQCSGCLSRTMGGSFSCYSFL
jgi:hypothetical protein